MTAPERGPNHHILAKDNILVIVCSSIFCFLNVVTELTLSYWNQLSPAASVEREGEWRPQPQPRLSPWLIRGRNQTDTFDSMLNFPPISTLQLCLSE